MNQGGWQTAIRTIRQEEVKQIMMARGLSF